MNSSTGSRGLESDTGAPETNPQSSVPSAGISVGIEHSPLHSQQASRTSSITNPSSMSRRGVRAVGDADADEITPIRAATGGESRNYNTGQSSRSAHDGESSTSPDRRPANGQENNVRDAEGEDGQAKESWYKSIMDKYGSISLENKGSVARDHLALERTFLAWLRTSLAFASIGIAVTQLFRLNTSISHRARSLDEAPVAATTVPYSPLVGHSIPADLAPYLERMVESRSSKSPPRLGPTLFDQLFMLDAEGNSVAQPSFISSSQNDHGEVDVMASDSKIRQLGKPLGATFIGISILILLVGFHRYFESQYWIIRGKFPASRGSIALIGLITSALIVTSLVVVVVVHPTRYEKK